MTHVPSFPLIHGIISLEVEATATRSSTEFQLDRTRQAERNKFTEVRKGDIASHLQNSSQYSNLRRRLFRFIIFLPDLPASCVALFVTVVVVIVVSGDFRSDLVYLTSRRVLWRCVIISSRSGVERELALAMPGKQTSIQEETRGGESAMEIVEDESGASRRRSFGKKAKSNSTRFSDTTRKRFKRRVNQWPQPSAFIDFESDAEKKEMVHVFRQVLVARELLPPRLDDYRLMKRCLKASKYDIEDAVTHWKKEYGRDSILEVQGDKKSSVFKLPFGSLDEIPKDGNRNLIAPLKSGNSVACAPQLESFVSTNRVPDKLLSCQDLSAHGGSSSQNFLLQVTRFVVQLLLKLLAVLQFAISLFGRTVSVAPAKCNVHSGDCSLDDQLAAQATKSSMALPYLQRLQKLESLVSELSKKPVEMPFDKDNMLSESLGRIKSIEYDLQKTKKALHATASKQLELAESLENLKEKSGRKKRLCWPNDCKHLNAGS